MLWLGWSSGVPPTALDDWIGQAAQIAADLLPEAGDSEPVEAG
jgi:hypothetical protein